MSASGHSCRIFGIRTRSGLGKAGIAFGCGPDGRVTESGFRPNCLAIKISLLVVSGLDLGDPGLPL